MSDNRLVKTFNHSATLAGSASGIGWIAKVTKESMTSDPSSNLMNYVMLAEAIWQGI